MGIALPYPVPAAKEVIRPGKWLLADGRPLPEIMPSWDYATDLSVKRKLAIDVPEIRRAAQLPEDAKIGVAAVWWPDTSKLKRTSEVETVPDGAEIEVEVEALMTGAELGGILRLQTIVTLREDLGGDRGLLVHRAGSELWSDTKSVRLQGEESMFPLAITDFSKTQFASNAPWALETPSDFEQPAMGSIYLMVNERNPVVVRAVENAQRPDGRQSAILSAMYYDVGRILVELALSDAVVERDDFAEDSFGAVLHALVRSLFPTESLGEVKRRTESDVPASAARLAAALALMDPARLIAEEL